MDLRIEVNEKKRATFYRNGRRIQRAWTHILPELPRELLVADDGSGIAMVDFYYGNNHVPDAPVVIIFGEGGREIARYPLKEVANLSLTTATTSMSYWYHDVKLMESERILVIETMVAKHDRSKCGSASSPEEAKQMFEICTATAPYEELSFELANGKLISRVKIASR